MRFIGLDLAWSARNPTGAAVVEGDAHSGRLITTALLGGDDEVIAFVQQHAPDSPALVTIDAPLAVPNATGRRPGEAEIATVFARYHAGAHPANRTRLAVDGVVRGEALVERLDQIGFTHRADVAAQTPVRQVVEVFPHPAIVSIFGLDRIIPYKARPKRTLEQRLSAFEQFRAHLRTLASTDPALHCTDEFLARDLAALRIGQLKGYEDQLDGLMCAYIGQYLWRWGMARARVFGTFEAGYITTPVPESLWSD